MCDRETNGCRYIIGELKSDEPWRFCGAELKPGSSYCATHHAACYRRLRLRKRAEDGVVTTIYLTDIVDGAV